jgi:hypothetical protein
MREGKIALGAPAAHRDGAEPQACLRLDQGGDLDVGEAGGVAAQDLAAALCPG